MTFAQLQSGEPVFLDANVFVYDFAPDPTFGPPCQSLLNRIEMGGLTGIISSHELRSHEGGVPFSLELSVPLLKHSVILV